MNEVLAMGGYGAYVWSSFGLTFVVLLANIFIARHSHRKLLRDIRRQGDERS